MFKVVSITTERISDEQFEIERSKSVKEIAADAIAVLKATEEQLLIPSDLNDEIDSSSF